ncbi:MAG TPA: hypothetical protein VEL76_36025 [Gemmataceae bacterium]|nr:hypothetical protein [Gemmataceae bacterium]
MLRLLSRCAAVWWSAALAAVMLAPAAGLADPTQLPGGANGVADLKRAVSETETKEKFTKLLRGETKPGPDDQKVLDTFAQWYIYRMTWVEEIQGKRGASQTVIKELESRVKEILAPEEVAKRQEFLKQFTGRMIASFRDVLSLDPRENRVALVNTAQLLPIYAKTKEIAFGEYLTQLLQDEKQHLIVKLYAVKALREYLPGRPLLETEDPTDKTILDRIARQTRWLQTLLTFIDRDWEKIPDVTPEAGRFIRREAIGTLAHVEAPAMQVVKGGKVEAPAAYLLLRVLAPGKNALSSPPPSLSERGEAALGVCRLKPGLIKEYQPEVGYYFVGQYLLDFMKEYVKDTPNLKTAGKVPLLPWKAEAARFDQALNQALKEWDDLVGKDKAAENPVAKKFKAMAEEAKRQLAQMKMLNRSIDTRVLQTAVNALRPANGLLFRGVPELTIDLTAGAD